MNFGVRFDRNGFAEPRSDRARRAQRAAFELGEQLAIGQRIGWNISFEYDRRFDVAILLDGQLTDHCQVMFSTVFVEPRDLEWVVAFDQPVGVVVDRFAGASQKPGGGVFFAQDQVRVGFAALQGDSHGDLPKRAACERIRSAQRL